MPPMEADAAYQGCLSSCELHSRLLAVGRAGASDLEIAHVLRNPEIACTISGFRECAMQSRDYTNSQIARNMIHYWCASIGITPQHVDH